MSHMESRTALTTADQVILAFLIGVWALPWAVLGFVVFAPWLAPWMFTPVNGPFFGALVLYVADGLGMPLMVLAAGVKVIGTSRGWLWLAGWITTVVSGFAFQYATLPFLISMYRARDTLPGHWHWEALAWGGGFALLAVAAETLVRSTGRRPPRGSLVEGRARVTPG